MSTKKSQRPCVIGRECPTHAWVVHGGEAEELRKGLEKLRDKLETANERDFDRDDVVNDIYRLLDSVDARDSAAWVEHRQRTKRKEDT